MKQNLLLKSLLLLCILVGSVSSAWATEEVYKTITFCNAGTDKNKTSSYTSSWTETVNSFGWTIANFNNNNWGWTDGGNPALYLVKCGRKKDKNNNNVPSVATITTNAAIDQAITKVVVALTAIDASDYNSIKLYMASTNAFDKDNDEYFETIEVSQIPTSAGNMTITIPEAKRAANRYYKLEFDTKGSTSSNGHTGIKKVEYYYNAGGESTPSITSSNVDIAYDATNGSIAYTLNNATGNVSAATTSDWLTLDTENITASAVPFTCSANTGTTARTAQVKLSFTGATDKVVTVTQAAAGVANPSINVTSSSPTSFSYVEGNGPSDASTISVSGSNLTANISISFGDNSDYEMSLAANGTYTNSLTLTQSEGTVSKTTIYFRLKAGLAKGTHNGTLTLSSTGAADVVINLSGTVTGQTHAVTCVADPVAGGTIEANPTSAKEGQEVTVTCTPAEGYTLSAITITKTSDGSATDIKVINNKFTMPDYAVTATATFLSNTYEGTFALYSGALTEGDYLLVYDGKAMNNSLTKNKFGGTELEISNNVVSNPYRDVVWHIAPSSTTGYWTIYNAKANKYVNADAFGTDVFLIDNITSSSAIWASSGTDIRYFQCKENKDDKTATVRYLCSYGKNGSFGNYASSNNGSLTLYKYTVLTDRTITFDGNGGTYNEATTYTQDVYDGVLAKLDVSKFTKTGYEFAGWNTNANGENGTAYADGANIIVTGSDLTLYAQWAPLYTLTIDNNIDGGSVAVEGNVTSAIEGTEIMLTSTPTAGHKFSAWNVYKAGDTSTKVTVSDENKFNMPAYNVVISATFEEVQTYSLVTNVNQLVSGKHYIIASGTNGTVKAMGEQKDNNRGSVNVTATSGVIPETTGVYEFVIYGPDANDYYTIYDETNNKYLYAASSSNNYLKTQGTNNANGKWTIAIANTGVATVKAKGSYTRNWMRNNGDIFSCYGSGQNDIYFYVKDDDTPVTTTASVKLNAYGYATFASTSALDFLDADADCVAYSAWQITGTSSSTITFGQIKSTVAAGKGVFLKGTPDATISLNILPVGGATLSDNKLVGTLEPTPITTVNGDYTNFGLSGGNFVKIKDGTLPANKAYLPVLTSSLSNDARLNIVFNDETTGVQELKNSRIEGLESCYDLQGRRVEKPTKGLYIVNGKKVVIK